MIRVLAVVAFLVTGAAVSAQNFDPPPAKTPDAATLTKIEEQTAKLKAAVTEATKKVPKHEADLAIYVKAAEWIVRHQEWFTADSGKQTLAVIEQGLKRAEAAKEGKTPWLELRGQSVARGYRSIVDGSVQPYGVIYPQGYGEDPKKKWRLDVHLHGRDSSLTEVKHLFQHASKPAPKEQDFLQINIYGRGNNAYRWAGEADVFEAVEHFLKSEAELGRDALVDRHRIVLKGFSMGGAGTWHIGLRHPDRFAVLQPGAGFTTTHGYIAKLPDPLPPHQEACLRIYDAFRYAGNAWDVPIVAYSGENDRQKQAADTIEAELRSLKLESRMTHLVAPGLEHKFPPEWQQKADAEVRKRLATAGDPGFRYRVQFTTFTLQQNRNRWLTLHRLGRHYERARVDASTTGPHMAAHTENVTALELGPFPKGERPKSMHFDDQFLQVGATEGNILLAKKDGKWSVVREFDNPTGKRPGVHGPIDHAFTGSFLCVVGTGTPNHAEMHKAAVAQLDRFRREWDKYLRGELVVKKDSEVTDADLKAKNIILFGDPGSNSLISQILRKLPIRWTKSELEFGGLKYDAGSHLPVLIQPSPFAQDRYVVLNSGHTFHETDFKGTNALLYPRLGDYAVVKPTPTAKDPAAFEVITAGLFDENWQFPKK
jgi:predicted esterase